MADPRQPMQPMLRALPLWAQVLAAVRVVRRAVLALPQDGGELGVAGLAALHAALDAAERCAFSRECPPGDDRALLDGASWRGSGGQRLAPATEAVFWAVDACRAAIAADDFPVDASVTHAAMNAIAALSQGSVSSRLQVWAMASADIDMLRFATDEARQGRYDPVPGSVPGRLLPLRALDLWQTEARSTPSERDFR